MSAWRTEAGRHEPPRDGEPAVAEPKSGPRAGEPEAVPAPSDGVDRGTARHWRMEAGTGRIATLILDCADMQVNLLTTSVMQELRMHLQQLAGDSSLRGLLILSGKDHHFLAGADVAEIRAIQEAVEGQEKAAEGQALFQLLAEFPVPTCTAIDGACMGGGLELALACNYRIATDSAKTKMALPEVQLGILPAFGGTTRLPRLVGLVSALDLLLTGKPVEPRKARRIGLVDDVVPHENYRQRALQVFRGWVDREESSPKLDRNTKKGVARITGRKSQAGWMDLLIDGNPIGRGVVLSQAEKRVRKQTQGNYPAPLAILGVLRRSGSLPVVEALHQEAVAVGNLLVSPESRNLTGLFFLMEGAKKSPATPEATRVRAAAVLGAGVMGGGIAALLAKREIRVRLKDIRHAAIGQGLATARDLFERERKRRRIDRRELERRMGRISGTLQYDGLKHIDVVVEAVVESLDIKHKVLTEIEEKVPEDTVLATNTSSLLIESIAEPLRRRELLVGLHFFNPVHRMPLIEVVVGKETSPRARDTAIALARQLGKTPVIVRSSPGFLVNRILMPYLMEALHLFQAGVPIEDLDEALEQFGMPMGPLALLDEIGLDTAHHVADVLGDAFPDRGEPPRVLGPMVEGGRLGKKNRRGFYRYNKGARKPDPAVYSLADRPNRAVVQAGAESWTERLLFAMVNEAVLCLEEEIVSGPGQLDLAMILGTGFPPFRGGLLRYADTRGAGRIVNRLQSLAETEGPRFEPAALLRDHAQTRARFREDFPRTT